MCLCVFMALLVYLAQTRSAFFKFVSEKFRQFIERCFRVVYIKGKITPIEVRKVMGCVSPPADSRGI